jgi:SH3-like domain-containing protein
MKKIGIPLLAIFLAFACSSRMDRSSTEVGMLLDSLQAKFAPDDRIALWDLDLSISDKSLILSGEVDQKAAYKAIVSHMDRHFPEVTVEVVLLPEDGDGRLVHGLVNNSVIHLRREPSSTTEMVSQVLLGRPIRILKEAHGKYLIQTPDGYLGWVNIPEVQPLSKEEMEAYREMDKIIFSAQYGFAYSEPDQESLAVADLVVGCMLPVLSTDGEYYQVVYPDGRQAWVKKSEARKADEILRQALSKEGLVKTAMAFHGIPYLWGGTSSKAIDCSGLVTNVYFMNGIQLPRDADQQTHLGKVVSTTYDPEGLETGDLLFFGRKATEDREEAVTHVAMYLGEGEFIHSAGFRERVSVNSMDPEAENFIERYPEIFIRTVRIIGEEYQGFEPVTENRFFKEILAPAP